MKRSVIALLVVATVMAVAGCPNPLTPAAFQVIYDGNGNTGGTEPADSNSYEQRSFRLCFHRFSSFNPGRSKVGINFENPVDEIATLAIPAVLPVSTRE